MDARNLEDNDHGFAPDGEGSERSLGSTTWVYCRRGASRATQRFLPLVDGEVDGSSNEGCPNVRMWLYPQIPNAWYNRLVDTPCLQPEEENRDAEVTA